MKKMIFVMSEVVTISEVFESHPQGLTIINRFLTPLTNEIIKNGTIDKYM